MVGLWEIWLPNTGLDILGQHFGSLSICLSIPWSLHPSIQQDYVDTYSVAHAALVP